MESGPSFAKGPSWEHPPEQPTIRPKGEYVTDPASSDKGDVASNLVGWAVNHSCVAWGVGAQIPNCIGGPICAFCVYCWGVILELRTERFTRTTLVPTAGEYDGLRTER